MIHSPYNSIIQKGRLFVIKEVDGRRVDFIPITINHAQFTLMPAKMRSSQKQGSNMCLNELLSIQYICMIGHLFQRNGLKTQTNKNIDVCSMWIKKTHYTKSTCDIGSFEITRLPIVDNQHELLPLITNQMSRRINTVKSNS